jgi:catalase
VIVTLICLRPQRIKELQIRHFYHADPAYGTGVATGLGLTIEGVLAFESKAAAAA